MDGNELEVLLALRHKNEHYGSQMEALPDTVAFSQSFRNYFLIFFFQAEDGIRDKLVTGVQTCALPISGLRGVRSAEQIVRHDHFSAAGSLRSPCRPTIVLPVSTRSVASSTSACNAGGRRCARPCRFKRRDRKSVV